MHRFDTEIKGSKIVTDDAGLLALRHPDYSGNGLLFSAKPIALNELFLIEVVQKDYSWSGNLRIGIISEDISKSFYVPEFSIPDFETLGYNHHVVAITKRHNTKSSKPLVNPFANLPGYTSTGTSRYLNLSFQEPTWDDLSFGGSKLEQQYYESLTDVTNCELPVLEKARIGIVLRPNRLAKSKSIRTADMHVIINGYDQGAVRTNIPIDFDKKNYVVIDCYARTRSVRVVKFKNSPRPLRLIAREALRKYESKDSLKKLCEYFCGTSIKNVIRTGLI